MRRLRAAGLLASYALLALALAWPALSADAPSVVGRLGGTGDVEGTLRTHWFFDRSLEQGRLPSGTDLQFFPVGWEPLKSRGSDLVALAAVPLRRLLGFPACHNALVAGILFLNALAGYLLFIEVLGERHLAWLMGAVLATSPYVANEIGNGHLDGGSLFFLLLAVRHLLRCDRGGERHDPWLSALFSLLATATYPFFALLLALFAALLAAWRHFGPEREAAPGGASRPDLALLTLLPALAWFAWLGAAGRWPWRPFTSFDFSVLMGPFQVPLQEHLIVLGSPDPAFLFRPVPGQPVPAYLGWPLALAVPASLLCRPRPWFWMGSLAFFYALCLGPCLKAGSEPILLLPNPLYLLCYKGIPFFSSLLQMHRVVAMVTIAACALAGFALLAARKALARRPGAFPALVAALALLWFLDGTSRGLLPLPASVLEIPPACGAMGAEPGAARGLTERPGPASIPSGPPTGAGPPAP